MGACVVLGVLIAASAYAELFKVERQRWKPVPDDVYLQEAGGKIPTETPVTAMAVYGETVYAVASGKLHVVRDGALQPVAEAPKDIERLRSLAGALWAASKSGVHRFADNAWRKVDDRNFVDFCAHLGAVYGATSDALYRFENGAFVDTKPEGGYRSNDSTMLMEDGTQLLADPVRLGPIDRIASHSGTLYMLRRGRLALLDGITPVSNPLDWGILPSPNGRALLSMGSRLYVATDRGLGVIRGMAAEALRGADGLPYEDTTCLTEGFDGDLWIGTARGAIRKLENEFHYFSASHWLPGDRVHDIAVADHTVYIATEAGLGVIRYEPYTLAKKAAYFERELGEWGHKRLGFIHKLFWDGKEWVREISDNDGGHTAHYLAAMSFKYACTGDEAARQAALDAFKAMIWLDDITPSPGFIARAIWSTKADKGKRGEHGSGGLPAKWYPTADGLWFWKGDTSSDEVVGHIYAVSIFHDLAAKGPEKERAKRHLVNIATHIQDNGWVLRDMDGKPTRWGRWDPEYLLRPYGYYARGLNGMEAQTFMRLAYGVSGDKRFEEGYQQLLTWGYHNYTVRQKLTFTPDYITTWDDELAFRCYYTLLRYTDDPAMRSIYLRSLDRSWETKRMERVAWFSYIYGAATGNDCEAEQAAKYLREWPLDSISHSYTNSHRADLGKQPGYVSYTPSPRAVSPRETAAEWGSCSALELDGGSGGRAVTPPISWLEHYWMGRYHGFIEAPKTSDAALTTVEPGAGTNRGAAPYAGPSRPANLIPGEN